MSFQSQDQTDTKPLSEIKIFESLKEVWPEAAELYLSNARKSIDQVHENHTTIEEIRAAAEAKMQELRNEKGQVIGDAAKQIAAMRHQLESAVTIQSNASEIGLLRSHLEHAENLYKNAQAKTESVRRESAKAIQDGLDTIHELESEAEKARNIVRGFIKFTPNHGSLIDMVQTTVTALKECQYDIKQLRAKNEELEISAGTKFRNTCSQCGKQFIANKFETICDPCMPF